MKTICLIDNVTFTSRTKYGTLEDTSNVLLLKLVCLYIRSRQVLLKYGAYLGSQMCYAKKETGQIVTTGQHTELKIKVKKEMTSCRETKTRSCFYEVSQVMTQLTLRLMNLVRLWLASILALTRQEHTTSLNMLPTRPN